MASALRLFQKSDLLKISTIRVVSCPNLSNLPDKHKSWLPAEKTTHTGQRWAEDDYRLVRFIDRPKQINEKFAINLIAEAPPTPIKGRHVYCNGGGGPLGHPKVYINLDPEGAHSCGYCGLRFIKDPHHH